MKRIKLVDVDNKYRDKKQRGKRFPNLALAKTSADEKSKGNIVGFDIENPDKTYISCIFTKNRLHAIWEVLNATGEISFGGSGIWLEERLPPEVEFQKPDYDLYSFQNYSFGFTSRGCPRQCGFCIVREKEGCFKRHQHIKEFHDFRFKSCKLLDNNILFDKEWFFEQTNWAIENKVLLDITQGMDIRLLTDELAEQISRTKFVDQQIRFAWDIPPFGAKEEQVIAGVDMLKDAGINIRRNVSFYVLVGAKYENGRIEEIPHTDFDFKRISILKSKDTMTFLMKYHNCDPVLNHMARFCNRRQLYRSCTTIEEYLKTKKVTV